jgi:hypothetical protein
MCFSALSYTSLQNNCRSGGLDSTRHPEPQLRLFQGSQLSSFLNVLKANCHSDGRVALRPNFDAARATRPVGHGRSPIGYENCMDHRSDERRFMRHHFLPL